MCQYKYYIWNLILGFIDNVCIKETFAISLYISQCVLTVSIFTYSIQCTHHTGSVITDRFISYNEMWYILLGGSSQVTTLGVSSSIKVLDYSLILALHLYYTTIIENDYTYLKLVAWHIYWCIHWLK